MTGPARRRLILGQRPDAEALRERMLRRFDEVPDAFKRFVMEAIDAAVIAPSGLTYTTVTFTHPGAVEVSISPRAYFATDLQIRSVFASRLAGTADASFDILKNGTVIETIVITGTNLTASAEFDSFYTFTADTDYMQVQCTSIGGSDGVTLHVREETLS